ncbi:hypothetical protein DEM27_17075 [Metarhizobium album]|uniref:DUF1223 domain-containing protein n=1 Tax=Metarhizobium album TaxID=2182425 RepID=A0A2U2DPC9_9HYPH|nr:thioredoxin family protein [Rhizobium album]PWE55153.1 hypothetical protein DEM27_17075 [Rhizobium album]
MPVVRFVSCLVLGVTVTVPICAEEAVKPKGVVELFTSQGCSSCPPADAALEKLIRQGDVVAIAYHVDYWNYLGWKDTMSSKENTERQYAYARTLGRANVYTPQVIVNGRAHMKGTDLQAINAKLDSLKSAGDGLSVGVEASLRGDELEINIGPGTGKANVVIAYFDKQQVIKVDKGENTGREITYWHTVTDVQTVGMWEGMPLRIVLPANVIGNDRRDGCAILLQSATGKGDPSAIYGATMLTAPSH